MRLQGPRKANAWEMESTMLWTMWRCVKRDEMKFEHDIVQRSSSCWQGQRGVPIASWPQKLRGNKEPISRQKMNVILLKWNESRFCFNDLTQLNYIWCWSNYRCSNHPVNKDGVKEKDFQSPLTPILMMLRRKLQTSHITFPFRKKEPKRKGTRGKRDWTSKARGSFRSFPSRNRHQTSKTKLQFTISKLWEQERGDHFFLFKQFTLCRPSDFSSTQSMDWPLTTEIPAGALLPFFTTHPHKQF